jgi:hypothetical protein
VVKNSLIIVSLVRERPRIGIDLFSINERKIKSDQELGEMMQTLGTFPESNLLSKNRKQINGIPKTWSYGLENFSNKFWLMEWTTAQP